MYPRVASLDKHSKLLPPCGVRSWGLSEGFNPIAWLSSDGVIGLVPLDRLYERVSRVFREKLRGWREEDHEAYKLLERLVARRGDS